ncbi:prolyl oligopeptidase [Armatimonas rosea]|uniref:prolyl oligopeptidase n=2 Tax=Armatimonas rosea TaxID=685828 RepID=A0A7W9W8V9_ARMRO|nr:prolyl oligopeptidase [Armatimonas rosea]
MAVSLKLKRGAWRLEFAAGSPDGPVRAWKAGGVFFGQPGIVTKTIFVKAGETLFVRAIETLAEADTACRAAQEALPGKLVAPRTRIGEAQEFCSRGKPERVVEKVHEALSDIDTLPGIPVARLRAALSEVSAAVLNLRLQAKVEGDTTKLLLVNGESRALPGGRFLVGGKLKPFATIGPKLTASAVVPGTGEAFAQYSIGGGMATLSARVGPGTPLPLVLGPPTGIALPATPAPVRSAPPIVKPTPTPSPTKRTPPTPVRTTPPAPRPSSINPMTKVTYPTSRTVEVVDTYHGTPVADPYRWLEDANSAETVAWITAQNDTAGAILKSLPAREGLQKRLTALWNYERFGLPSHHGSRYFYSRNDGLQNQAVQYVAESLDAEPRVLLDPNMLSTDGTVALAGMSVSEDGNLLAYSIARSGSDWQEWHVRDVTTGKDLADKIEWSKFSGASWLKDGSGFFYSRYAAPDAGTALQGANYNHKVYLHKLGTPQSADTLVYERPDHPDWNLGAMVTDDGRWLVLVANKGTERRNYLFLKDLTQPSAPVQDFLAAGDAAYSPVGNDGSVFYLVTDRDAPLKRLVAVDSSNPAPSAWRTVLPESKETLQGASLFGSTVLATYLKDARSVVRLHNLSTGELIREVALPGIGTAVGFDGKREDTETFFAFSSYTSPTTLYRYDLTEGVSTVFKAPKVAFDPRQFETKQVFTTSKDGTKVPMFLTYKKGLELNGNNPVYLYAYGGFNISLTPGFSVAALTWMEQGGVYAVANLRGGGEYGKEWYEAGTKLRKQNVFDDFIGCAEWLIAQKYTRPEKLAIAGGSNGGLLVGACMTQRPDLFGVALPAVGVLDMLRFDKFTIGWAWKSDYGDPANADEFKALLAYSPYHNLKPGTRYPATLITTSDHDDRVVPAHSYKFAARLQAAQDPNGPPTLIRIETKAGHGAGKPTSKIIEEQADIFAFVMRALGMEAVLR